MKHIPDLLAQRARLHPDRPALIEASCDRVFSFAALDQRAEQDAAWLAQRGIGDGDRVAVLCQNTPIFFALLFAIARIGAILVPLNWRQTAAELGPILADCGARALIADAAHLELGERLAGQAGFACCSLEDFANAGDNSLRQASAPRAWDSDRVWYLLYTSGTTGRPKAVIQTFGMALANYVNVQTATGLGPETIGLNFLPLFHTAGINLHTLPILFAGGCSHLLAKFDADSVLARLQSAKVSLFFGVPQVFQMLAQAKGFADADLSAVRHWGCGGAPVSEAMLQQFLARGVTICNGMGMTETGPTAFFMDPAHAAAKIGSVGKPQILTEVRLVDADGRDVAEGEPGEILFRGPAITPGYFNNPHATAAAFTADGWLRSGDIGRRDPDGYYAIIDRLKDMFISGGENVYPAEIEQALQHCAGVLEAAVVGVPDERWGEVGHAALIARPEAAIDLTAIAAALAQRLARFKLPKYYTVLPDFPRTAAGKVQKHVLRRLLVEQAR